MFENKNILITGASGCGKSSLLKNVIRENKINEGLFQVIVDTYGEYRSVFPDAQIFDIMANLNDVKYIKERCSNDLKESSIIIFDIKRICRNENDKNYILQVILGSVLLLSEHKHVTLYLEELGMYIDTRMNNKVSSKALEAIAYMLLSDSENVNIVATTINIASVTQVPFVFTMFTHIVLMTPKHDQRQLAWAFSYANIRIFFDKSIAGTELLECDDEKYLEKYQKPVICKLPVSSLTYQVKIMDITVLFASEEEKNTSEG